MDRPSSLIELEQQKPAAVQRSFPHWLSRFRSYLLLDPLIFFYTFILGSASLAISFTDPKGEKQHAVARTWSRWILATAMCPVRVVGLDRVNTFHPAIYAANLGIFQRSLMRALSASGCDRELALGPSAGRLASGYARCMPCRSLAGLDVIGGSNGVRGSGWCAGPDALSPLVWRPSAHSRAATGLGRRRFNEAVIGRNHFAIRLFLWNVWRHNCFFDKNTVLTDRLQKNLSQMRKRMRA